jgi:hypothetical protein
MTSAARHAPAVDSRIRDLREAAESTTIDINALHPSASFLRVLGVNYVHMRPEGGGELYLTQYGVPFARHLEPMNWLDEPWFSSRRRRLAGTGTVYYVPTKPITGHLRRSIELAIKWSRVGEDIPIDTLTLSRNINAEFNSPFEEFALLEELRRGAYGPRDVRILTQKPLAIYVPPEQQQLWQTGRSRQKILTKITRHPCVEIDILRSYILVYGWVRGVDAVEAYGIHELAQERSKQAVADLTRRADDELAKKGFVVVDHKPAHLIVRQRRGKVRCRKDGSTAYALVDYELLSRTIDHQDHVTAAKRQEYLARQRDRFNARPTTTTTMPSRLKSANVMGVDYVYGRAESTNGVLWVVGRDPELFPYFLPERWRLKQVQLSPGGRTFYSRTKDGIHLVWKVSRLGDLPPLPASDGGGGGGLPDASYNTPFAKFAIALEVRRRGVPTVYPRAIYMTGGPSGQIDQAIADARPFEAMAELRTPDGLPVLPMGHDYISIWGYWRGLDDGEAVSDNLLWTPIDLNQAAIKGIITRDDREELIEHQRRKLQQAGFADLTLGGDHVLLAYIPGGDIRRDADGVPYLYHCNLELVVRTDGRAAMNATT